MATVLLATGLKILFIVLGCTMTASVIFTIVIDGLPFRKELLTPWMTATLVDFYINVVAIGAWIIHKQSHWISKILWLVSLLCFGSIATSFYIALQFLKLSPKESEKDPIYHVLKPHKTKSGVEDKNIFSVAIARVLFSALGFLMFGTLIYTIATAGSPFHKDLLFPWLSVKLIDFYANVVPLLVWVAYKERKLLRSTLWMIMFICLGSISTCAYIVHDLFHLDSSDPLYLVLFNSDDRVHVGNAKTTDKEIGILG